MPDSLAQRLLAGDKRALARAISLVEDDDPEGWELVKEVYPHTGKAAVVGFTGPPGAGKSTLIGALIKHKRAQERTIGVLSIDPSSPFRGGALLGDRIRLAEHFLDPGVFIRSMATRGALGGLAEAALQTALLMDAAGKDDVLLETVGVGQAEVDVIDHADSVVLVLIPGSGDSIQALKAGVMEIPDVIVVNKADHPLTDTMVREIRGVLSLAPQHGWRVPIVKVEAIRGEGVEELAAKLAGHRAFVEAEGTLSERRRRNLMSEVIGIAAMRMRRALEASVRDDPAVQQLLDEVVARRLDPASAAAAVLERATYPKVQFSLPQRPAPGVIRRPVAGHRRAVLCLRSAVRAGAGGHRRPARRDRADAGRRSPDHAQPRRHRRAHAALRPAPLEPRLVARRQPDRGRRRPPRARARRDRRADADGARRTRRGRPDVGAGRHAARAAARARGAHDRGRRQRPAPDRPPRLPPDHP